MTPKISCYVIFLLAIKLLIFSNLSAKTIIDIEKIEIYIVDKSLETGIRLDERRMKEKGLAYHTTLVKFDKLTAIKDFIQNCLSREPSTAQKAYHRTRWLMEVYLKDSTVVSISSGGNGVKVNFVEVPDIQLDSLIDLFKDFIPPNLGWYSSEKEFIKKTVPPEPDITEVNRIFDGFVLELNTHPKKIYKNHKKEVFSQAEIKSIKKLGFIELGLTINLMDKKIESIKYDEIELVAIPADLQEKLLRFFRDRLSIKRIDNQYNKQNQLIYRTLYIYF